MSGENDRRRKWYHNPVASFFLRIGWVLIALPVFGKLDPKPVYRCGQYIVRGLAWLVYGLAICWIINSVGPVANANRFAENRKNLEQTAIALKRYAAHHNGHLPSTLAQLSPGYIINQAPLIAKYRGRSEPWTYYSGHLEGDAVIPAVAQPSGTQDRIWLNSSGQQKAVIMRSPASWKDVWLVVFSDFTSAALSDAEFKTLRMDDSNPPAVPVHAQEQQR